MAKDIEVLNHILVPQHTKLTEEEKKTVLSKYNIGLSQLPRIRLKDPVLKTMGDVKVGDIIKIVRYSPTNLETTFFRVVVNE